MTTKPKIRILTTGGQQPEVVKAVENEQGVWFVDTLGKRWAAREVISYWEVPTK